MAQPSLMHYRTTAGTDIVVPAGKAVRVFSVSSAGAAGRVAVLNAGATVFVADVYSLANGMSEWVCGNPLGVYSDGLSVVTTSTNTGTVEYTVE